MDTVVALAPDGRITRELVDTQIPESDDQQATLLPVPLNRTKEEAEREMIYASILAMHRDVREVLNLVRGAMTGRPLETMKEVHPQGGVYESEVQSLSRIERAAIQEALRASDGNRRKAAEMLGISERTLYRKIKEYGLV